MFKTIVLFNHKGGVSKTTTTFNIAWKLTQKGKKVLIVDGDPQCNITGMFLGDNFDDFYEKDSTKNQNIKDAVSMAFKGRPQPIEAINCQVHNKNQSLYIIPGHMDLAEYEASLSLALNSNNAIVTLQNLPGAIYALIEKCAEKYNIDYVLIDMNPGLSAINQTFFMYSDAFIVPTNPDPFSIMALKTLKTILPKWKKWADQGRRLFIDSAYPLPNCQMKFIGTIIQRFNVRNHTAAKPYVGKIQEIKEFVTKDFVEEMRKYDMLEDITSIPKTCSIQDRCLGEIADFGSLIQKANDANKPVFDLTKDEMSAVGNVYKGMEEKRKSIDAIFDNICDIILETV